MPDLDQILDESSLQRLRAELVEWEVSGAALQRSFEFPDFRHAMAFMLQCSYAAEALNHHPNWENVYHRVQVKIFSHDRGGVTSRCVELARAMQQVFDKG